MRFRSLIIMASLFALLTASAAWSAEKIIYSYKADEGSNYALYTMNPGETDQGAMLFDLPEVDAWCPRVSPGGDKVAFIDRKTGMIWVGNMDGTELAAVASPTAAASLNWSSDGAKIYYWASTGADIEGFWSMNPDGGEAAPLWGGQPYWAWFIDGGFAVLGVINGETGERNDYIVLGGTTDRFGKCNIMRIMVSTDYQAPVTLFDGLGDNYTPSLGPIDQRLIFQADPNRGGQHSVYILNDDASTSGVTSLYSGNPWWNTTQEWFVFIHAPGSTWGASAYQGNMRIRYFNETGDIIQQITAGIAACPQVYAEPAEEPSE